MPQPLVWTQLKNNGDLPAARSGHSINYVGNTFVMFGGIDKEKKNGKTGPNNEVFQLRITTIDCNWTKEKCIGDVPLPRTYHSACTIPDNRMFIFGGLHTTNQRLNDAYILQISNMTWKKISQPEPKINGLNGMNGMNGGMNGGADHAASAALLDGLADGKKEDGVDGKVEKGPAYPAPRANHTCCLIDGKCYIFGGHGGLNYQRKTFNDMYTFDCNTLQWERVEYANNAPEPRGGHSAFSIGHKMYIFGGWNSENQYNNVIVFDTQTKEWSDPDIYNDIPRWNQISTMVEAIPSWKFFVFGGSVGEFPEGGPRTLGTYTNDTFVLDVETMHWSPIVTEDAVGLSYPLLPKAREASAMIYDARNSRLVMFGGWNNSWLQDIWSLNVSAVVGPPYAITAIEPTLGQLTGNTPVTIRGIGFKETSSIIVKFICGKLSVDVNANFVSETELTAVTPSFEHIGPKESEVRLSIQGGDMTNTYTTFSYFMNTRAYKSLAYGPGLLQDGVINTETQFLIQARNDQNENRRSGRDKFLIKVTTVEDNPVEVESSVTDLDNGSYLAKYKVDHPCEIKIDVLFEDDKGKTVPIRGSPYYASFSPKNTSASANTLSGSLMQKYVSNSLEQLEHYMNETGKGASTKDKNVAADVKLLLTVKQNVESVQARNDEIVLKLDSLDEALLMFQKGEIAKDSEVKKIRKLFESWQNLQKLAKDTKKEIAPFVATESEKNNAHVRSLEDELRIYGTELKKRDFYFYKTGVEESLKKLDEVNDDIASLETRIDDLGYNCKHFGNTDQIANAARSIEGVKQEVSSMRMLWSHIDACKKLFTGYMETSWLATNAFDMEEEVKKLMKTQKEMKVDRKCNAYVGALEEITRWLRFLPLVSELRDDSMRERHWNMIKNLVGQPFEVDPNLTLKDVYNLNLYKHGEAVEEITDQARQEAKMEKTLAKLDETWSVVLFDLVKHKDTDIFLMRISEENFEMLEENQVGVNSMFSSRFLATFEEKCVYWQKSLAAIAEIVQILSEVQRSWSFLENLFIHSEEVKKELPKESEKFVDIDKEVKTILKMGEQNPNVLHFCNMENIMTRLEEVQKQLSYCEKALNDFLDGKRRAFPRFYFVSTTDLLDILSNGNNPTKVMEHMPKIFQAIETLELSETGDRPNAVGMHACVGKEYVPFDKPLPLVGKVEIYLTSVIDKMKSSLNNVAAGSVKELKTLDREQWLKRDPSQITLIVNLCAWVSDVEEAFKKIQAGTTNALQVCFDKQVITLTNLIKMVQGDLDKPMRQKIMCMITMDTHSRDIIEKLITENVIKADEFQWQSQLKSYWDLSKGDFRLNIADAQFWYGYEYLGNGPRLVVTPLTDRIYVTATQALHLKMGCAPAGPAGTGKTETTKDLASAMGKACYVFNCSDQMDYRSMGDIFKGLASSGSWGCFDEFNRLVPEVLSVCSVQFKSVTDAIKAQKSRFSIQGDEIDLDPTCGVFITMNPGYLGRSELPEGLKALFRPITVVVPDLELICENMLMAEGFVEAKSLARKFTTLYALCKDLLSKQDHYDWGLRAIKSVLVVAGSFKRSEPDLVEQALLMRALRDFNIPKIVADDLDIFMGLLGDLFPGVDVPRKRDLNLEENIQKAATEFNYWPEPDFILKVVQLSELLEIRHCVFVMGPPGSGKSSTWKTLARAQDKVGKKTMYQDLNPKAVSTNELYGYVQLSTREWKDGLLSKTMRSLGQIADTNPKWIILDGDLDANWIESMNSVMDDNKILTLASNERIPLKPHMRMIFEIRDLKFATPATVSRAGILYISDQSGYQWKSYVKSWIQTKTYTDDVKSQLQKLFDKYIEPSLLYMKKNFKFVVPVVDISMVVSVCKLLESLLKDNDVKGLEYVFVFACVWGLGGGLTEKDGHEYRREFSNWWKNEWKTIKFANKGTVFDYFVDIENSKLEEWSKMQTKEIEKEIDTSKSISNYTVPTPDTVSAQYLMKAFITVNHPSLLVGNAGCGKTQIVKGLLNDLSDGEHFMYQVINFNYYTDAPLLQNSLEQQLMKRAGKTYAPPGKFKLIYFIDDLNMPMLDPYNTQTSIELVRQHQDYGHWYDRVKMQQKDVINTLYLACMNPTAGSFFVNPRLQRHCWMLAISFPESSSLFTIYNTFLVKHFSKFKANIQELVAPIIKTAMTLHGLVVASFRKTAINFHYEFNIRHLSNVFQGLLVAQPAQFQDPEKLVRLWVHESERIYGDRLVTAENIQVYKGIVSDLVRKSFPKFNLARFFQPTNAESLIFANFANGLGENAYDQFASIEALSAILHEALNQYNEINAVMDLVLFEDAMKHVCRISRIIANDGGHALLVGVGGSGKQSLSRLAASICNYTTIQIMISQNYGINELKADLQIMYNKAGMKEEGILFLFTEGQITNERFLVYINDLLSSGEIADLYSLEDKDAIFGNIRGAVKSAGIIDSKENCWNFFIARVKANLHMALCFSPVGDNFRNRARKFPALVNCTVIDWFQPWPQEALLSVATKFLAEVDLQTDKVREAVIKFMPYSFQIVNDSSAQILDQERRYVYTTPKSFLELIKLFKTMLDNIKRGLEESKERYETGVIKLQETGGIVSKLEEDLKSTQAEVEEKKKLADEQAVIVGTEKTKVEAESSKANLEAEKCAEIQKNVMEKSSRVQNELDEALPLVAKAQDALKGLDKKQFDVMKAFKAPPDEIKQVFLCVMNLLATIDPILEVDKKGNLKDKSWKASLTLMANPNSFLAMLEAFKGHVDAGNVPAQNFKANRAILSDPNFNKENIAKKSGAAGGLCDWVINITAYYDIVISVEPKKLAVREAQEQLRAANETKERMDALVKKLMEELGVLEEAYNQAMNEKDKAEKEAKRCLTRLELANRLMNALGSENERWGLSIEALAEKVKVVIGDVLLASAFVSYVGPFNKKFRDQIINDKFMKFFKDNEIPMSLPPNPLTILTDEATIAEWNNQKLPADKVSTENGAILTNSERYPLIIDPQLQGVAWIREKEKDNNLQITRLNNPKMIRTMESAIESGYSVLIENMDEAIDAVLAPVIGRNFIKKGKTKYLRLGDKQIAVNDKFKLFMHTKLSNPHYQPEVQAEATLINFTVTEAGLEDQLLALVVKKERPDLALQKEELIKQQNEFKIKLKQLETELLDRLTKSEGDILENIALIENLEDSKRISTEIQEKVEIAKKTEVMINDASEAYRPAANRGSLVFFMMNELYKIHSFYMYSLESFVVVVNRAIDLVSAENSPRKSRTAMVTEAGEEGKEEAKLNESGVANESVMDSQAEEPQLTPRSLNKRVDQLTESITYCAFSFTRRGLFERHNLLVATMLCLRIMVRKGKADTEEVSHLVAKKLALDFPHQPESLKFIPESAWPACKGLEQIKVFAGLLSSMESEALQWRKWYAEEKAEFADLPKSYRDITLFQRLLLLRALRPDRLSNALTAFVNENLGDKYTETLPFDMNETYNETSHNTPIFFVLFPGVDPTPDVERIAAERGISLANNKFINISMGQGQEEIAIKNLHTAAEQGHWIMLQNVHLMQTWLKTLERNLELVAEKADSNFRCFISSEPPPLPEYKIIPESILQNCVKVANEAPQDLKANIRRAFAHFGESRFQGVQKLNEFKALLFGLCMFHSLILGRRKFGSQGWSRMYNFNDGDLTICADVLNNYLAKYEQVPYDDLRYIYGEIMYGGHITDNWDRRTNATYLQVLIRPEIMSGMPLTPGFKSPDPVKFDREGYRKYIEEKLPIESPQMFGLHPNAEIGYLTTTGETLFSIIQTVQGGGASGGSSKQKDQTVKEYIIRFLGILPEDFSMLDITAKAKDKTPYVVVALQECERMNILLQEIRRSLNELDSGLKGQLNITDAMENLSSSLSINKVPATWEKYAYFSKKGLVEWFNDMLARVVQLEKWTENMVVPKSLWVSGLFNPMSFLTAIMQVTAREKNQPLDSMCLRTDVTNVMNPDEILASAESGAFVHGFFLEGAAWEFGRNGEQGYLTEMTLKELHPALPVVNVTAILIKDRPIVGMYECPLYVTSMRGPTYVTTAYLKMESEESDPKKWILAGVALLMSDD